MEDRISPEKIIGLDSFRFVREIKDPIYKYIHITKQENLLIDTPEFQRLDRLYQNPIVRFVYPSGTHTRKSHSLGVMHLYHKALLHILFQQNPDLNRKIHSLYRAPNIITNTSVIDNLGQPLSNSWWNSKSFVEILQIGRIAALLHDIGHGPYSHLFEEACRIINRDDKTFNFNHEDISAKIIEERLSKNLIDPISHKDILQILKRPDPPQSWFVREILDGPYDVDKLDYIDRDSYHCGTPEYGMIDFERIIDGLKVKGEKLFISKSAIGAVMNTFNALQLSYENVYFHSTCRIFDHMIIDALKIIPDYVKEIAQNLEKLLDTDDITFLRQIKEKASSSTDGLKYDESWSIAKDILNRNLRYSKISTHQITYSVAYEMNKELENLKDKFENKFKELKLIFDYPSPIRGLRIDPFSAFQWLTEPNIIDEKDDAVSVKNLKSVSESYYNTLKQNQILIYIFIDKKIEKSGTKEYLINSAKTEIKEEIENIKKKLSF